LAKKDKEKVKTALEAQGAKVIELEVSGGFHSPFMGPARSHLAKIIEKIEFMDARVPIVSNVTARPHNAGNEIKGNLISQLTSPVLWKDCVEFIRSKGVEVFFEIGPSRVLRGLMRKIDPAIKVLNIEKKEDLGEIKIVRTV
jgi:[acyl-carrier-protein] S-malonyltransferase